MKKLVLICNLICLGILIINMILKGSKTTPTDLGWLWLLIGLTIYLIYNGL
jgi:hypothetical protein